MTTPTGDVISVVGPNDPIGGNILVSRFVADVFCKATVAVELNPVNDESLELMSF